MDIRSRKTPRHPEYRIGEAVRRQEDPTLLGGEGRYTDDLNEPGQACGYIFRSTHAHEAPRDASMLMRQRKCRECRRSTRRREGVFGIPMSTAAPRQSRSTRR